MRMALTEADGKVELGGVLTKNTIVTGGTTHSIDWQLKTLLLPLKVQQAISMLVVAW